MTNEVTGVLSVNLEKSFYTNNEDFGFVGTQGDKQIVYVIIRNSNGNFVGMLSDPAPSQGQFLTIPRPVSNFFSSMGTYTATGFTDSQTESDGISITLYYDGSQIRLN